MKRGIFYLLGILALLIPAGVNAATGNISIDCPASVAKNTTLTCNVILNVTEGTINNISGTIAVDSHFSAGGSEFSQSGNFVGNNNKIGTITVVSKAASGVGSVGLYNIIGTTNVEDADPITAAVNDGAIDNVNILSDNNNLTDIQIDGKSISTYSGQTFSSSKNSYTISVSKVNSLKVSATLADSTASLSGTGTHNLQCGNNTITLIVTAQNKTVKKYQINVNRTCNSDVTVKKISLSTGTLNPTFISSTKEYNVNVSKDISKITISVEKNDSSQIIIGEVKDKVLDYGENKITIKVTSETGTSGTYVIIVNREDSRSTNAYLSDIKLSDGKLLFDKDTLEYTTKVLNSVTKIDITAIPEDKTSKIEISSNVNNLQVGNNTIIVKVTAEHGEVKEYKINVNRLKEGETLGDNPNIASLEVINYNLGFTSNKTDYTLKIEKEKTLNLRITLEEKTASYVIKGNENLKNGSVIKIIVTSEDGTTKDYTITVEKSSLLLIIMIAGACLLIAIGLIIYLLIKNKKNKGVNLKEEVNTNKIKNKIKSEDEILNKVEEQLKQIEDKNNEEKKELEATKPITIVPTKIEDISSVNEVQIIEDEDTITNQQLENISNKEATKVCSICGHRVSISAKECPYCRRSFYVLNKEYN